MILRYCTTCQAITPNTHTHGRWQHGSTRQWRRQRARTLNRDNHTCWCGQPATEVHHMSDTELRSVCSNHNPRGK